MFYAMTVIAKFLGKKNIADCGSRCLRLIAGRDSQKLGSEGMTGGEKFKMGYNIANTWSQLRVVGKECGRSATIAGGQVVQTHSGATREFGIRAGIQVRRSIAMRPMSHLC
jgi:hypothetical protein